MDRYKPFYDDEGCANLCKDCCVKAMKGILRKNGITTLKLKNKLDFEKLMEVAYEFVAIVEDPENQEIGED